MSERHSAKWLEVLDRFPQLPYTRAQALANAELLQRVLGEKWLRRGSEGPSRFKHLVLNAWSDSSPRSFAQMNSLAEDLRILQATEFVDVPILDLKRPEECDAAWHVLHSAALFARAPNQKVMKFFPKTQLSVPDFVVRAASAELISVEAKLLMRSEIEENFVTYAKQLQSRVFATFQPLIQLNPFVKIIIKDPQVTPTQDEVLGSLGHALGMARSGPIISRHTAFNILVDATPQAAMSFAAYRGCTVLAPRAPSENLRVFDRAKKAGRQIKAGDEHGTAGLFCLGITKHQDPHWLSERFSERFSAGNYSGLSAILFVARAETGRAEEIPLDFALSLHNPKARVALPVYQLQSSGSFVKLGPKPTVPVRISAYEYCHVECKAGTPTAGARLDLPMTHALTPELLL